MSIFEKWDKSIDVEGLKADIAEAEANGGSGDFAEVPVGTYEVKIEKMELKVTKKGDPMFSAWFRILTGEHEKQMLFMNQVITQGFQIGIVSNFLRSLEAIEGDIEFVSYEQYNDLILDIAEVTDDAYEYLLEFKKSKNDFSVYTVKEVYELD